MRAKFLRHEPCPKCNSKNNLAVYDSFSMCMTPGCGYRTGIVSKEIEYVDNYQIESIPDVLISERKLTVDTINTYSVGIRTHVSGAKMVSFPYYKDGQVVWVKNRGLVGRDGSNIWHDKKFWSENAADTPKLFGLQTVNNRKPGVLILEGEIDCLSAYQMYGLKYNCLSIANGAQSARDSLIKHMKYLESTFTDIILCFDMDSAGRLAADECMKLFAPGKARNCILPNGFKDASDMLVAGKDDLFREAVNKSQASEPPGVLGKDEAVAETLKYILNLDKQQGVSTGFKGIDRLCGGFRGGELITLTASTGIGKSTLALNFVSNVIEQQVPVLFIPLEMTYKTIYTRLVEMRLGKQILVPDMNELSIPDVSEIQPALEYIANYVHCYNAFGAIEQKNLIGMLEFYCRCYNVKLIVLDHLHAATNTVSDDNSVRLIDNIMSELKRVALQYDVCILVISHLSRSHNQTDDDTPSLSRLRGSASIAQYSDMVIGITRPRDTSQAVITTLKAHRLFSNYNTVVLEFNQQTLRYTEGISDEAFNAKASDEQRTESEIGIRKADNGRESIPDIRASELQVSTELHPGLHVDNEVGETDIHREQGVPNVGRQEEITCSEERQPGHRFEDIVATREQALNSKSKVQDILAMVHR